MLIVSGLITLDPEAVGAVDKMAELVAPLVEATRAEPGNVSYGFWSSLEEPNIVRAHEEWQDTDALNAHMASEHMAEFMAAMGSLPVIGVEIYQYDVSETTKLM